MNHDDTNYTLYNNLITILNPVSDNSIAHDCLNQLINSDIIISANLQSSANHHYDIYLDRFKLQKNVSNAKVLG